MAPPACEIYFTDLRLNFLKSIFFNISKEIGTPVKEFTFFSSIRSQNFFSKKLYSFKNYTHTGDTTFIIILIIILIHKRFP